MQKAEKSLTGSRKAKSKERQRSGRAPNYWSLLGSPNGPASTSPLPKKSIEHTLAERGARYGLFHEHAKICQEIKEPMMLSKGWERLKPDQRQALETIADKIARILNGDPTYVDNWHDIAGYATLVENRLLEQRVGEGGDEE